MPKLKPGLSDDILAKQREAVRYAADQFYLRFGINKMDNQTEVLHSLQKTSHIHTSAIAFCLDDDGRAQYLPVRFQVTFDEIIEEKDLQDLRKPDKDPDDNHVLIPCADEEW